MSSYINYVLNNFPQDTCVLEIGAGFRSTKSFSQYFNKMYSIEHDHSFIGHYDSEYLHVEINNETGWYDVDQFRKNLPKDYDLIILDGPQGGFIPSKPSNKEFRYGFCNLFQDIKKNVIIIVDDTDRPWREVEVVEFLKSKGYRVDVKDGFTVCHPQKELK